MIRAFLRLQLTQRSVLPASSISARVVAAAYRTDRLVAGSSKLSLLAMTTLLSLIYTDPHWQQCHARSLVGQEVVLTKLGTKQGASAFI